MGIKRRRASVTVVVASLLLVLAVAGCGSSSKSGSSLTKAQFLAKANAICKAGNVKTNALGAKLNKTQSQAKALQIIGGEYIPAIQSQIDQVRALGGPAGDQAKVTAMLNLAQSALDKVKGNPKLLFQSASPFHAFALQAHAYGMTQCAQNA
jgi:hypothetical protein